jgi:GT2 family glycosyltransferase
MLGQRTGKQEKKPFYHFTSNWGNRPCLVDSVFNMKPGNSANLSIVIVTPAHYDTIRKTISCLRKQTVQHQLEVVIVAPSAEDLKLEEAELTGFFGFNVVEVGAIRSIASANAAGIRQATAPIVALGEDHAFPDRNWADALIKAHRGDWAAVGPQVRNANPENAISWADYLMGYGPWIAPATAGQIEHLPGHNSSYKRDILLEYGAELEVMLSAESVLHWHLRSNGHRLYLEPQASIAHLNFDRLGSWLPALFYSARIFAATRSRTWSWCRCLFYTAAAPFIPITRLLRIQGQVKKLRRCAEPARIPAGFLAIVVVGLVTSALGEMVGYAMGGGNASRELCAYEFHRERHLNAYIGKARSKIGPSSEYV